MANVNECVVAQGAQLGKCIVHLLRRARKKSPTTGNEESVAGEHTVPLSRRRGDEAHMPRGVAGCMQYGNCHVAKLDAVSIADLDELQSLSFSPLGTQLIHRCKQHTHCGD